MVISPCGTNVLKIAVFPTVDRLGSNISTIDFCESDPGAVKSNRCLTDRVLGTGGKK